LAKRPSREPIIRDSPAARLDKQYSMACDFGMRQPGEARIWMLVAALVLIHHCAWAGTNRATLFLVGDSTMANKPVVPANFERGWGQLLPLYFGEGLRVENHAMNGRTARSFVGEGRWKIILDRLQPGDFVLVQFGHNDQKDKSPSGGAFASYKKYLERYIKEARERGATPIIATSVVRRRFDRNGKFVDTLGDYPKAARQTAEEMQVPLLELHRKTMELLQQLGPEKSIALFNHLAAGELAGHPDGARDDTHFNALGATRVCDLAVDEIMSKVPALAAHLKR
jgi:lysophospholipase L1-like esterase